MNPEDVTYTFDSRDNILSNSETRSVVTRVYDAASRLVSSSDGSTYTFDANGNLTAVDDVKSEFEYDKENRLIFYSSESNPGVDTTMVYNAFGQKKRETNPDSDTLFTWDGDDYYGFADAANDPENAFKIFIGDGGTMLGEFDPADSQSRMDYMVDFLGSVTGQTNKKGDLGSERRFKPFGELLSGDSVKPLDFAWTGNTGSMHTGLLYSEQYNRARHYSTTTNIWTTRDPLWPSEHAYGYVGGNSATRLDPSGQQCRVDLTKDNPCSMIRPKSTGACITAFCSAKTTKELIKFLKNALSVAGSFEGLLDRSSITRLIEYLDKLAKAESKGGPLGSQFDCCKKASSWANKPDIRLKDKPTFDLVIGVLCRSSTLMGDNLAYSECARSTKTSDACVACCEKKYPDYRDSWEGMPSNSADRSRCINLCIHANQWSPAD